MTKQTENLVLQAIQETQKQPGYNPIPSNCSLPIGYMPTPTRQYRAHRKAQKATVGVAIPNGKSSNLMPLPVVQGSRALMWKPESCISEPGLRKTYLPGN